MKKLIFVFLFAASLFGQDFGIIEKPSKWTDNGTSLAPRYPRSLKLSATAGTTPYGVIYKDGNRFIHDFNYGNNGTVTTLGYNTFVGINAGNFTMGSTAANSTEGSYNTGVGYQTLYSNTTGDRNSAMGYRSLYSNTTGYYNSAMGMQSLHSNTTGHYNSAMGYRALYSNTTGYYNSAMGMQSLYSNTTGYQNSAMGMQSLYSNTTGNRNSAMGLNSLYSNTTGSYNSAMGMQSLYSNTTGYYNSAMGYNSLYSNTTGYYNSAMGYEAGNYIADGSTANATGNNSVFLGYDTRANADGETNQIVIGASAIGNGSNSVTLGNDNITKTILKGNIGIGTTEIDSMLTVNQGAWIKRGLRVGGETTIAGNRTDDNDYAERYITSDSVIVTNTDERYLAIAGETGLINDVTDTNDSTFTITTTGIYEVDYAISFTHDQNLALCHAAIFVNDVVSAKSVNHDYIGAASDYGHISGGAMLSLTAGETLKIKINADKTGNLTVQHFNLRITLK